MSQGGDVFDGVMTALAADATTEFGVPDARIEVLRRIDGPFSAVQRVRIQTSARTTHAYVKVMRPRRPGAEELKRIDRSLEREYLATQALYETLRQNDRMGAVRPIAWLPEHRALVTEEVPGRPLGDLLAEGQRSTDELALVCRSIGAWVRLYQRIDQPGGMIELAERRVYVDDRLKLLEGRVLSAADRQATLSRFDALASEVRSPAVRAVPIHADLSPQNIIIDDGGRVTVLDFTMAKAGTESDDLSHLYFHFDLMAARQPARVEVFRQLQHALLTGYSPTLSADDPLFRLMRLQQGVCHVALLAERHVPVIDAAYRWFLRRRWRLCQLQLPGMPRVQELPELERAGAAANSKF
jgi:serine/threonine protein kinase